MNVAHELESIAGRVGALTQSIPPHPGAAVGLEDDFNQLALDLFAAQNVAVPVYAQFCRRRGVLPGAIEHWTQIPAMPTLAFRELDLTAWPVPERTHVFYSSGTTHEQRSRHFHNARSLQLYEQSLLHWFRPHLLPEFSGLDTKPAPEFTLLGLTPGPEAAPHSSLVHMFASLGRQMGMPTAFVGRSSPAGDWSVDLEGCVARLQEAQHHESKLILAGTAFNWVHLTEALADRGQTIALPPGSRLVETGGYKGRSRQLTKNELYAALTRHLGIAATHIVSEYGMSELSSQAYDAIVGGAQPRRFHFPPWARVQVISPETGKPVPEGDVGLIRVLDLANVWSVLAVQTEDLARPVAGGFEWMGRAGRAEARGCSLMSVEPEDLTNE